jgi:hypothetical protein
MRLARGIAPACIAAALLAGCVYDPYYPYGYPTVVPGAPASYERSWDAALGAIRDNGMNVVREDRVSGVIEGQKGGLRTTAQVIRQADGGVRVEFNTNGALSEDPSLPDKVSRAYDARMGR